MSGKNLWKLRGEEEIETFHDIRMKVGNKIIRAYLLDSAFEAGRVDRKKLSLRGPKDEFFDAANFLVIRTNTTDGSYAFLIQAGVYSNLRIVGADREKTIELKPEKIVDLVTEALENPAEYECKITLSDDTKVTPSS